MIPVLLVMKTIYIFSLNLFFDFSVGTDDYGFTTKESVEENMEIEAELEKELLGDEEELTKEEAKTMLEELNMLKNELKVSACGHFQKPSFVPHRV